MAKVTRYSCDFNPNLAVHDAHFHFQWKDAVQTKEVDVCSKHLVSMFTVYADNAGVREILVRHVADIDAPPVGKRSRGLNQCPECEQATRNVSAHMKRVHGVTLNEWRELNA